jgi:hypothetical protein
LAAARPIPLLPPVTRTTFYAAEAAGVSTNTVMKIERMKTVLVSETGFKERGKVPPEIVEKLEAAFKQAGFRLVPATETRPARVEEIKDH